MLKPDYRLVTLFLYMVAELSALQQIVNALTGLNGLSAVIVECAVTTIYTCMPFPEQTLLLTLSLSSTWRFPDFFHYGQHPRSDGRITHCSRGHRRRS